MADVAATLSEAVDQGGRIVQQATSVPGVTFGLSPTPTDTYGAAGLNALSDAVAPKCVEPVGDGDLTGPGDPQDEIVARDEISLAFVAALRRLAPRQRAALLLHDVLGFTHAEVGGVLDIGTTAVNSLLSRARVPALALRCSLPRTYSVG